jgi:hypothetical protein
VKKIPVPLPLNPHAINGFSLGEGIAAKSGATDVDIDKTIGTQ